MTVLSSAGMPAPDAFRAAMRTPASSVVIVATGAEGTRAGCTVTAICSLSDSPPSLLVCLNRRTSALAEILANGRFSANYLGDTQSALADVFAGRTGRRGEARFGPEWVQAETGVPVLKNAAASFECALVQTQRFGSHDILIGRVDACRSLTEHQPLIYAQGSYGRVA